MASNTTTNSFKANFQSYIKTKTSIYRGSLVTWFWIGIDLIYVI